MQVYVSFGNASKRNQDGIEIKTKPPSVFSMLS